ncbi:MAG: DNA polymerase I [Lentisphaeria bacterium]|nr:DNA polymerase I [Candidatus Neomarinimicrobiota bacterium]MCF7842180.1 DNA polymerase I [Lentisphaeria bacterium]
MTDLFEASMSSSKPTPPSTDADKTLYLIDGSALAYRAHFAFIRNPLINSKGQLVSAVYGFTNSVLRLLIDEKPRYIAVVMDTKEKTFRHEKYPDYKATREKMPDEMSAQLPVIDEILDGLAIPVLRKPGFEADDIIGTLSKQAARDGVQVKILTGDKDFAQLVNELVVIENPKDNSIWTPEFVQENWGVPPENIIDLLGLMGDSSDNVPGVPGVGPKTAVKLLQTHRSIEKLYENIEDVKNPKLKEKLLAHKKQAFLSKDLVTIKTDMELDLQWKDMLRQPIQVDNLTHRFQELELFSFIKLLSELPGVNSEHTGEAAKKNYTTVRNQTELKSLVEDLMGQDLVAFDLETTSLKPHDARIVGLSFSWEVDQGLYVAVDFPEAGKNDFGPGDIDDILAALKPFWDNPDIRKTGQNLKYDLSVLRGYGIAVQGIHFDSMLAAYLVNPGGRGYNLDDLAQLYLGYQTMKIEDLEVKQEESDVYPMHTVPVEKITFYAAEDADIALQLTRHLQEKMEAQKLMPILERIELPLIDVLSLMEWNGAFVDVEILNEQSNEFKNQLAELEKKIYAEAGEEFNINSPKQLGKILFEKMEIPPVRKTKTGYSTDVNVLETLAKKYTIPKFILDYRQVAKLKSTYTDALPQLVHPKTGRIHSSFNQTIAATGRLSSTNPNFQNIPIRTEMGRDIRRAFRPQNPGWKLASADYSQVELRLMAHYSEDETLIAAFKNDEDVHRTTAAKVFNVPPDEVTSEQRRRAKVVNFGIMYGAGPFRMSNELDISRDEALELIDQYFNSYPGIRRYIDATLEFAREHKYVQTLLGRRRPVPDIDAANRMTREGAERVAINMPIQGTAADIIKLAMIEIHKELQNRRLETMMILQVHDELVFELPEAELEEVRDLVTDKMENAYRLKVPLKVDLGVGDNWLEAH